MASWTVLLRNWTPGVREPQLAAIINHHDPREVCVEVATVPRRKFRQIREKLRQIKVEVVTVPRRKISSNHEKSLASQTPCCWNPVNERSHGPFAWTRNDDWKKNYVKSSRSIHGKTRRRTEASKGGNQIAKENENSSNRQLGWWPYNQFQTKGGHLIQTICVNRRLPGMVTISAKF